ncbi:MAG: hypothetical protein LBK73_12660 [Treponema sp.]|nr:hypothetical protein [Treponema sp.]
MALTRFKTTVLNDTFSSAAWLAPDRFPRIRNRESPPPPHSLLYRIMCL